MKQLAPTNLPNDTKLTLKDLSLPHSQNITTLNHIERLYNILYIQEINGLKLPDWTRSIYPEKLLSVAERNLALLTETNFMKRIRGGKFFLCVSSFCIELYH